MLSSADMASVIHLFMADVLDFFQRMAVLPAPVSSVRRKAETMKAALLLDTESGSLV
jgi:hypothetical protein